MHCPRCGQQQVSEQTKFCSRCGFQLGLVSELLEHGGFLPQLADLTKGKPKFFTRKNGVIFSILWFIFWVMMVPAFFGIADAEEAAGVSAVFGLFTTLMFVIVSLAFLPRALKVLPLTAAERPPSPALYGNQQIHALPPQHSQPATDYAAPVGGWRTPDTGELARPGSVTESTTKLLQKDKE
ncbi:MAG TPA: zinc ribbon domain-containing protein [Pyrinomonadaceae bacterium]|nr:zinc ribbon domain-containing protein [Pyrinomonadaceae bacterium]